MALTWTAVPGAAHYHLELGGSPGFRPLLVDRRTTDPHFAFRPQARETFAWRVAAVDAAGHEGPFGHARRFTVAALPGAKGAPKAPATAAGAGASPPPAPLPALPLALKGRGAALVATVIGRGLSRQPGGHGAAERLRGRVRLEPHDVLAADHSAGLRLGRGLVLGLEDGSRVEVEGTGRDQQGRFLALRLEGGAVSGDIGTHAALHTVYLENAHARVALASGAQGGTRVRASQHDGTLRVAAERGVAEVLVGDQEVKLPAGHGLPIPDGAAPGALVALPGAPPLVSPRPGARFATGGSPPAIEMKWRPVEGGIGYQVRISYDPEGTAVAYQGLSQSTMLVDNGLAPGTYFWTVRALDPRGFSSAAAPARRLVVTRPAVAATPRPAPAATPKAAPTETPKPKAAPTETPKPKPAPAATPKPAPAAASPKPAPAAATPKPAAAPPATTP